MSSDLTIKQNKFCQKYIETGGNASEAYRQAYDAENMAPETIHNEAHILLKNPDVTARIEHLESLALKRHQTTVDRVVAEYARLAFLDVRKAFDADGSLKPLNEIDDDTAAAIAGIEVEEKRLGSGDDEGNFALSRVKKLRLSDKKGALDSLAKYLGMFTDKVELTGKDGKPIEISDAKAALLRGLVPDASASRTDTQDQ